jgi:hypothetical protein
MARRVKRRRGGDVVVSLDRAEAEVIETVISDVSALVAEGSGSDDVTARLFPRAYLDPTEERAETDWQDSVHDDLVRSRLDAFAAVLATLRDAAAQPKDQLAVRLDAAAQANWLTAVNDVRLVIGTMLGVTEDSPEPMGVDDPRFALAVVYDWLTDTHWQLVETMLEEIPEEGGAVAPEVG